MLELSAELGVFAADGVTYIAYDAKPGAARLAKMAQWPFVTKNILGPEGNESAEKLLREILPAGMSLRIEWSSELGMVATLVGERGEGKVPLAEVAKRYLELLADNANSAKLAKAALIKTTIRDDNGYPGQWIKGVE